MTNPIQTQPLTRDLLARAGTALDRHDPQQAGELAVRVLQTEPQHPDAHYIAGRAALELGQMSRALQHLHEAAILPPRRADYIVEFARALARTRRNGEALEIANIALAMAPRNPLLLGTLAMVYTQCHAHERAASVSRQAAALAPENSACRFNHAMALAFNGEIGLAQSEIEACLALEPGCWPAHGLLSRLHRQTPLHNHVDRLLALIEQAGTDPVALTHLHMALGKEYEDLGDYASAFDHFTAGKSASRPLNGYSIARDEAIVQALIDAFPQAQPPVRGCPTDEPIFIIGMPRSGTTLVERMLSSHPEVYSAGELDNFGVVLDRLVGGHSAALLDPDLINRARNVHWEQLGEQYLSSTRPFTSLKPRFTDKFPHNFLYAGFIANALPNASIVCLRRNPLDTCLGNLREPFAEASPFHSYSFDLLDTGRYYILFDRLMTHWKRVLPGRILEIDYETLVASPEASSRQLLEHCGLPWNDACLHFERNPAPATTASSLQVRTPIHQDAVRRWKKYETQLAPLRELLTAAGIDCGP